MFFVFLLAAIVAGCDPALNDADGLNPECNYAGTCYTYTSASHTTSFCYCCDSYSSFDYCQGAVPGTWRDIASQCAYARVYTVSSWAWIFTGLDVECADDGISPAVPDYRNESVATVDLHYSADIMSLPCSVCTPSSPCDFYNPPATSGTMVKFGTDLNTYYDADCGLGDLPESVRECDANYDNGAKALLAIHSALDFDNDYAQHIVNVNTIVQVSNPDALLSRVYSSYEYSDVQAAQLTRQPTPIPTSTPTRHPNFGAFNETTYCDGYANDVEDLKFLGAGSSCRANINESWTGGRTCDSPYIICLPRENTPSFDIMGQHYKNDTHRYTVQECLSECSYDQRCLGIEFVADSSSALGDCNLLDDIPLAIENEGAFSYSNDATYTNLDNSTTGSNALCWSKFDYCNPNFEAEDLSDVMLNCYCPNNRKGFYTKKVKRTVNNTRFCDNDSSVDERIMKAQANRMFHLCENWCLFETSNPEQENWYWDPWKQCFRETYSARGTHRGYCDRVIRNPDSIELKFVNYRTEHFCTATKPPTSSPVADTNTTWILGDTLESCDDACSRHGSECAAEQTATRFSSEEELRNAFGEAGTECGDVIMNRTIYGGWALPGIRNSMCYNRQLTLDHLQDLYSDCNRKLGNAWQRLCACF